MTITNKLIALLFAGFLAAGFITFAYGDISAALQTEENAYKQFSFFSATTTNATSTSVTSSGGYFIVAGAREVGFLFSRGGSTGPNTGSSRFEVEVSPDGIAWYDYNTLSQNLATSSTPTTLSTVSISAATSTTAVYMQNTGWYAVRCLVIETTDGDHTCSAFGTW